MGIDSRYIRSECAKVPGGRHHRASGRCFTLAVRRLEETSLTWPALHIAACGFAMEGTGFVTVFLPKPRPLIREAASGGSMNSLHPSRFRFFFVYSRPPKSHLEA